LLCPSVQTKYHSKELNAKDDSNNSSSAFANLRELIGTERKRLKQVIYYSNIGDIGADFPQMFLIISSRNKLVKLYSVYMYISNYKIRFGLLFCPLSSI